MIYRYNIKDSISDDYLIEHYNFVKVPWLGTYNLVNKDEDGLGIQIFWKDRSVRILVGDHAEYGICPIPSILTQLINDKIIEITRI